MNVCIYCGTEFAGETPFCLVCPVCIDYVRDDLDLRYEEEEQ